MKMGLIYLLCFLPVVLFAQKHTTLITGKIKNPIDSAKIVVEEKKLEYFTIKHIGEYEVTKDGSFQIPLSIQDEGIFYLMYNNNMYWIPIKPGQKLKITFDAKGINNRYEVVGSLEASNYMDYNKQIDHKEKAFDEFYKKLFTKEDLKLINSLSSNEEYHSFNKTHPEESRKIDSAIYALQKEEINALKIITYPLALYATFESWGGIQMEYDDSKSTEYALIVAAMEKKYPKSRSIAIMKAALKKVEQTKTGKTAPEIMMPDTSGLKTSLSSLRGKYVLIDFWASWCAPCRAENPNLVAAFQKYKDQGFTILGVSLDSEIHAWKKAIRKDSLNWHHISDLKGRFSESKKDYHITGIPANFLLDKNGVIIEKNLRGKALNEKLASILKK